MQRARDEFLAGPPLADDEHGARHRGDALDEGKEPAHGRGLADEGKPRLDRRAQLGVGGVETTRAGERLDEGPELSDQRRDPAVERGREDQEVVRTRLDRAGRRLDVAFLGGDHDRHPRRRLASPGDQAFRPDLRAGTRGEHDHRRDGVGAEQREQSVGGGDPVDARRRVERLAKRHCEVGEHRAPVLEEDDAEGHGADPMIWGYRPHQGNFTRSLVFPPS